MVMSVRPRPHRDDPKGSYKLPLGNAIALTIENASLPLLELPCPRRLASMQAEFAENRLKYC